MTDELTSFVRDAVAGMGVGRFDEPRPLDEPPSDVSEAESGSDVVRDGAEEPSSSDQAALAVANDAIVDWVATLDPEDQERAARDPDFAAEGFRAFLAASTDARTAATLYNAWLASGDDSEAADVDVVADALREPSPGRALARAIYNGQLEIEGSTATDFLIWASSEASPEEWRAYAEEAGLDPALRPGQGDLPPAVEMERLRRSLAQRGADIAAGRRPYIE